MELSEKFMRNDQFVWRVIDGNAILLSPNGDRLHSFNEVATLIWEFSDGTHSIENVIDHICEEFDVQRNKVKKDVVNFTERLIDINALVKKG